MKKRIRELFSAFFGRGARKAPRRSHPPKTNPPRRGRNKIRSKAP